MTLDVGKGSTSGENNVITLRGPKHAQFANEDARLLTFRDWPQAMPQKPKDLAEAGFFYLGVALAFLK